MKSKIDIAAIDRISNIRLGHFLKFINTANECWWEYRLKFALFQTIKGTRKFFMDREIFLIIPAGQNNIFLLSAA